MAVLRIRDPVHPGSRIEKIQIQVPGSRIRDYYPRSATLVWWQDPDPDPDPDPEPYKVRYWREMPKNVRIRNTNTNSSMICNTYCVWYMQWFPTRHCSCNKRNLRHLVPVCTQKKVCNLTKARYTGTLCVVIIWVTLGFWIDIQYTWPNVTYQYHMKRNLRNVTFLAPASKQSQKKLAFIHNVLNINGTQAIAAPDTGSAVDPGP